MNRFTDGTEIRHFVMAVTSTGLMTKGWLIIFACLLIGAGAVLQRQTCDSSASTRRKRRAHDAPKSVRSAKRLTVAFARLFAEVTQISPSSHALVGQAQRTPRFATTGANAGR